MITAVLDARCGLSVGANDIYLNIAGGLRIVEPAADLAVAAALVSALTETPFPADTVFLRAKGGAFDAVLTMYHDQGQIAMKLMGFDRGVTILGGFPFPICTPAHGTAYDIAGQGIASVGASRAA